MRRTAARLEHMIILLIGLMALGCPDTDLPSAFSSIEEGTEDVEEDKRGLAGEDVTETPDPEPEPEPEEDGVEESDSAVEEADAGVADSTEPVEEEDASDAEVSLEDEIEGPETLEPEPEENGVTAEDFLLGV